MRRVGAHLSPREDECMEDDGILPDVMFETT